MRMLLLLMLAVWFWPEEAGALDKRGQYTVYGAGSVSCSQWTRSRKLKDSLSQRDQQWIAGYVTAYNRWVHEGRSVATGDDPAPLYAQIDRLCEANPLETVNGAAESLILDLIRRQ
ncbi:MAG: hypothetical protein MI920_24265 [Kiloniellales bacterium]|nr:hypothetical protein [Kiloniellales bacterium]